MKEFVGVKSWAAVAANPLLKRDALIFRRIVVTNFKHLLEVMNNKRSEFGDHTINDLEWLFDKGFIIESPKELEERELLKNKEYKKYKNLEEKQDSLIADLLIDAVEAEYYGTELNDRTVGEDSFLIDESRAGMEKALTLLTPVWGKKALGLAFKKMTLHMLLAEDCKARITSIKLRELNRMNALPILLTGANTLQKSEADKSDIVEVALNAMPIPDDSTSWEQIFEYRTDPDTEGKFMALRNWMNEVARADLTPLEIEEKLEWLLYDYQRHLKLHKMKTDTGTLETIVVTSAEILEHIMKFNWGKVAKLLFSLRHRQVALMEGEIKSPGNEVAYIFDSRDKF